jgi:hypothetical protein
MNYCVSAQLGISLIRREGSFGIRRSRMKEGERRERGKAGGHAIDHGGSYNGLGGSDYVDGSLYDYSSMAFILELGGSFRNVCGVARGLRGCGGHPWDQTLASNPSWPASQPPPHLTRHRH